MCYSLGWARSRLQQRVASAELGEVRGDLVMAVLVDADGQVAGVAEERPYDASGGAVVDEESRPALRRPSADGAHAALRFDERHVLGERELVLLPELPHQALGWCLVPRAAASLPTACALRPATAALGVDVEVRLGLGLPAPRTGLGLHGCRLGHCGYFLAVMGCYGLARPRPCLFQGRGRGVCGGSGGVAGEQRGHLLQLLRAGLADGQAVALLE